MSSSSSSSSSTTTPPLIDPTSDVLTLARTYATFLRTTLTPQLSRLLSLRDTLSSKLDSLTLLTSDMLKYEIPGFEKCTFPPRIAWSDDLSPSVESWDMQPSQILDCNTSLTTDEPPTTEKYDLLKTITSPITSSPSSTGLYLQTGLNFYVECLSPSEVLLVIKPRETFLKEKLKEVEDDIVKVREDIERVLDVLKEVGGEFNEEE